MEAPLAKLFDLSGKTALVTGGGRGIGRDIAVGLAQAGADVVAVSRKLAACEAVAEEIRGLGRRAWAIGADLSKLDEIERCVASAVERTQGVDILVNNAAFGWGAPMLEHPVEGWDRVFDLNVRGLFFLTQAIAARMIERGGGCIVNIGSIAAFRGAPDEEEPSIAYTASKGAVHTLTRDLAVKLAGRGVRVNAIAPGPFDTDMLGHISRDPARLADFLEKIPLRRVGGGDDIRGAVVFLASDAAAFVTGQILVVDGGWSVRAR